jgi:hypothetical protein
VTGPRLLRLGALAGMVAAVGGVVLNLGHPRVPSADLNDTEALLREVAGSAAWRPLHLGTLVVVVLGVAGLVAVVRSMTLRGDATWPLVALGSALVTTPVLLASLALDGFAVPAVADRWAAAGGVAAGGVAAGGGADDAAGRAGVLAAAEAVRSVDLALLNLALIGHFGVTALASGVASWTSPAYGRKVGSVALLGGVAGIASGTLQALSGELTTLSYLVLLTVSLVLFTVWLLWASVILWRATRGTVTAA